MEVSRQEMVALHLLVIVCTLSLTGRQYGIFSMHLPLHQPCSNQDYHLEPVCHPPLVLAHPCAPPPTFLLLYPLTLAPPCSQPHPLPPLAMPHPTHPWSLQLLIQVKLLQCLVKSYEHLVLHIVLPRGEEGRSLLPKVEDASTSLGSCLRYQFHSHCNPGEGEVGQNAAQDWLTSMAQR